MKAILVIDMPSNCDECPLCDYEYNECKGKTDIKPKVWVSDERQPWCPLRELPNYEINNDKANQYHQRFCNGWNAMVDYCLNKEDEEDEEE